MSRPNQLLTCFAMRTGTSHCGVPSPVDRCQDNSIADLTYAYAAIPLVLIHSDGHHKGTGACSSLGTLSTVHAA